jgi:serine/threonine-protein kinase HipA
MKRCPITYEVITDQEDYSRNGLRLLSPNLKHLETLNLSADEQRKEAILRVGKMSIQGVQTKLSAQLNVKQGEFEIVDRKGHFILKPQSENYLELPENEALTMSLAAMIGLEVPVHGLVYSKDNSMTYFIKRFDRIGVKRKLAVEDFAQLSGGNRHTKYKSSMENIISIIRKFCTFPTVELAKLFKLTVFNFLVGNEDMHLKNFSLITRDNKISLSPAYDLLNSTIAINAKEEIALPLNGKKNNLTKQDFLEYFAKNRLDLNTPIIEFFLQEIKDAVPVWYSLISHSFLSAPMQQSYLEVLKDRLTRLGLQ